MGGLIGVATTEKNGLYPASEVKKSQHIYGLDPGQTIDTGMREGLVIIGATTTGGVGIYAFGFNYTARTEIVGNAAFDSGSFYIRKDINSGNILITNNRDTSAQIWFQIVSGF